MSDSINNVFTCPFTSLISESGYIYFVSLEFFIDLVMSAGVKPFSASDSNLLATSDLFMFATDIIIHLYLIRMGERLYLY